jgi:hypothetical protein
MAKHIGKTSKRQSVLERNSSYRSNCGKGHMSGHWEAHHIACNHAVEGREIGGTAEYRSYVEACLWNTPWDLNDAKNLVGLPKNKEFRKLKPGDAVPPYCSHQVDHNTKGGYTDECKAWLKKNVWDSVKVKKKKHDFVLKSLKSQLDNCTTNFKRKLDSRAKRERGTAICWRNRQKASYKNKWYKPFSMGKKPTKRSPGADNSRMKGIFAQIS